VIVGGSKCVLADGECAGRLEWHHAIKQQRLKRKFPLGAYFGKGLGWQPVTRFGLLQDWYVGYPIKPLDEILGDTRNRVWLCSHHHEKVTNGRLKVELPESVWEFAAEFGLTAQLENDLARQAPSHEQAESLEDAYRNSGHWAMGRHRL
jgi:hypothetical protein